MKVSIITICYNSAATIEDTIKSVVSQDYPHIEYIIIDGASKDNTLDIVDSYNEHITTLISEPDKGIYDAMNKGVNAATGDVVGILNSDDFYANASVITAVVNQLNAAKTDALYADLVYVDRDNPDKVTRTWISGGYKKGLFKKGWMPPHPTFFVKKSCYDTYGLYSTELRSAADYELMLRMIHKHEISLTYLKQVITKMRVGGESNVSLKNRLRANREDKQAWKMNDLKPSTFTMVRKPLSKLKQFLKK